MPAYIIKPDRDEDFYVRWSTIVDCPTNWGPRATFMEPPERFERADANGSSMLPDPELGDWIFGGWDEETFLLREQDDLNGTDEVGGAWLLPRGNLREFCRRRDEGKPVRDLVVLRAEQ